MVLVYEGNSSIEWDVNSEKSKNRKLCNLKLTPKIPNAVQQQTR